MMAKAENHNDLCPDCGSDRHVESNTLDIKLGRFEAGLEGLRHDLGITTRNVDNLCNSLNEFKDTVNNRFSGYGKTNWSVVLTAVIVVMAIYTAAIRPLEKDTERHAIEQTELAKAVLIQNEKHNDLKNDVVKLGVEGSVLAKELGRIAEFGSGVTDKRLTVVEELFRASEQRASEQRASEQRASEQRASEQRASEQPRKAGG